jgi:hypothetical protein
VNLPSPAGNGGSYDPHSLPASPEITVTQLDRFLELQAQELGLRAREMDLRQQELQNAHAYSEQSLRAQLEDRDAERRHQHQERVASYGFVAFLFTALLTVLLTALLMGKDEFARELLKAVLYVVPAGAGGYFAGLRRGKSKDDGDS